MEKTQSQTKPPLLSGGNIFVGHALEMVRDRTGLFRRGYAELGDVFAIRLGTTHTAVVTGAELNKQFYLETDKALNAREAYRFMRAAVGGMFLTAPTVEDSVNQLPILKEIFQGRRMVHYIAAMDAETQRLMRDFGDSGEIEFTEEILKLTQHIIAHAFIGADFRSALPQGFWVDYELIAKAFNPIIPPHLPLPVNIRRDRARKRLGEQFLKLVHERRQNPDAYDDLITAVMTTPQKDGTLLEESEIIDTFVGLMFAGHETTAGQLPWLLVELIRHPDYLELVRKEIDQHVRPDQPIDHHVLRNLEYTFYAIDEITRLHPSAELQIRVVDEPIEMGGYLIPKGWQVMVNGSNSHFLPEVWENPNDFDPLRYAPERQEGQDAFAIVGFGGGKHKCTGMNFAKNEMAVVIARLLQHYDFEIVTPTVTTKQTMGPNRPTEFFVRYRPRK